MYNLNDVINTVICGDCVAELDKIPQGTIDLVFADPPYNLQLKKGLQRPDGSEVAAVDDAWDKFDSFSEYDDFTHQWLSKCQNIMSDTATIWVSGTYHNIFRVGKIMMDLGFWFLNDIIWMKTNPMPHFRGVRFANAHETLLWAKKSEEQKDYTFNYMEMKNMNGGKQMRSDWHIPICSGNERIKVDGEKAHSTQKPEELLGRVILSSSEIDDIVLDPFFGTGTTGVVAKKLARKYVGIEVDPDYVEISRNRLNCVAEDIWKKS